MTNQNSSSSKRSLAMQLRRWLAGRTRNVGWVRPLAQWQARQRVLPYALRFRIARWANLLTLDAGMPEVVDYHDQQTGLIFKLNLRDFASWMGFYFGRYQQQVIDTILLLISPQTCCIELGSNIGLHTLFIGRQYAIWGKQQSVIAFEPSPSAYEVLREHIHLNQLENVILPYPMAVSDFDGESELYLATQVAFGGTNSGNNSLRDLSGAPDSAHEGRHTSVRTVRLDTFWQQPPTDQRIGLIKADIEGAELPALRGACSLLRSHRPCLIFEAHPVWMRHFGYRLDDVLSYLRSLEYEVYFIKGERTFTKVTQDSVLQDSTDCLALPVESEREIFAKLL